MNVWAPRIAVAASSAAAIVVLLIYIHGLDAPFVLPKFTALEVAASVGLVALVARRHVDGGPRWAFPVVVAAWLVLLTSVVAWAASLGRVEGAPYGLEALARWGAFFGLACGVSVLEDGQRQRLLLADAVTLGAVAVAALGLLQNFEALPPTVLSIPIISVPGSTFGNRNLAAEIMAMALPFSIAGTVGPGATRRILLIFASMIELAFLAVTRTRGSWAAAGLAFGVLVGVSLLQRRFSRQQVFVLLGGLFVAGALAALPAILNTRDTGDTKRYASLLTVVEEGFDARSPALRTRLGLWRRSVRMIGEYPLLGVGPGNWPVLFPRYAEPGAAGDGVLTSTLAPRQAHDDFLERTAETGLVGFLALLALGVTVARALWRRLQRDDEEARTVTMGALGSLVALVGLSITSFPLEMPGTLTLAAMALGLVVTGEPSHRPPWPRALWAPALVVSLALVVAVPLRAARRFRGSHELSEAERALHGNRGVAGARLALPHLQACLAATSISYMAELRTTQMLLREKRFDDAIEAARRIIAVEPYSPNGWGVLAAAHRAAGHVEDSRDAATRGLTLMHEYPLALDVRADAEEALGDKDAAREDRAAIRELALHASDESTRATAKALSTPAP